MYAIRTSTMHDAITESNTPSFWHAPFVMRPNKAPNIVPHEAMAFPQANADNAPTGLRDPI